MPRKPRIEFVGGLYHVIARGNQRKKVFLNKDDYYDYLTRLWDYHEKFYFILYAYCLMPNHIHLLLETGDIPLSKIMHGIQFSYTQSFNHRHKKVGHLFQGRYKAILCNKEEYLFELIRYIHLNPVRAKMVKSPNDYKWSSHLCILGLINDVKCDVDKVLRNFGRDKKKATRLYNDFVSAGLDEGHRKEFYQVKDSQILGDEKFAEEIVLQRSEGNRLSCYCYDIDITDIVKAVSREFGVSEVDIHSLRRNRQGSFGREIVVYLSKKLMGKSMREMGIYFSRGESSIARRYRSIEKKLFEDSSLNQRVEKLCNLLTTVAKINFNK